MDISRELAITILKYLKENRGFYFPFQIMCKEHSLKYGSNDFEEITLDELNMVESNNCYKTFQLWENLQDLREDTTELLSKGFVDKIIGQSLQNQIT